MTIDEPYPANPSPPPPLSWPPYPGSPPQIVCTNFSTRCSETGTGGSPNPYQTQPNIFVGTQNGLNTMEFNGIPFDAPVAPQFRVIRFTNIRANAAALGVSSTLIPTQINMVISINGNAIVLLEEPPGGTSWAQSLLNVFPSVTTGPVLSDCQPHNASLLGGSGTARFDFTVQAVEAFSYAFNFRNYGTVTYGVEYPQQLAEQNVPGLVYSTESGFYSPSLFTSVPDLRVGQLRNSPDAAISKCDCRNALVRAGRNYYQKPRLPSLSVR